MLDCTSEYLTWMCQCCGRRARADLHQLFKPVLPIEAQNPEFFDLQALYKWGHVSRDQFGPVEQGCLPSWLFNHAPADFDECRQLPAFGLADALQSPEVLRLPTGESGDGPCL